MLYDVNQTVVCSYYPIVLNLYGLLPCRLLLGIWLFFKMVKVGHDDVRIYTVFSIKSFACNPQ